MAVEHVEHLPAEIQASRFSEAETLRQADVLVEYWESAQFGIVTSGIAECRWLRWKNRPIQEQIHCGIKMITFGRRTPVVIARDRRASRAVKNQSRKRVVAR